MKELANRLAMQHLVNAYSQETGKASLFEKYQQNSTQLAFSQGLTLLSLPLSLIQAQLFVPLSYVSRVGRHRIAALPQIFQKGQKLNFSATAMVSLLLEELVQLSEGHVDAASLVERWIQSRDALQQFLNIRAEDFDALVQLEQGFIESEQALILGHSMHPAPKSRTGFVHEEWQKYSPEACGQTQMHYWLVAPEYIAEGTALEQAFSIQLKQEIKWHLSESELETLAAYAHYKLLPLHPWQARYLQSKVWFKSLKAKLKIIDLGEKAWIFSPTTSVRTLASFNAPWMLKPSLSVMITNSIRVNLAKECHRGEMTHRLWHSELGRDILKQCPTLKAVNDPAWIALQVNDEIIDETICIVRDQPFTPEQQVTCIASLCQDHPVEERNRFNALFDQIASQQKLNDKVQIAHDWFKTFLNISLSPLMYVYHRYGMAFESHQQNVLVELKDGWPQWLWLRDNQGFYYIEELADEILQQFPELNDKAHAVGSKAFVDERFSYYFFGNTLFGIINAIGATDFVSEQDLLSVLQQHLFDLLKQYPESSLIQSLLYQPTLPYKGNLLTRLHELDELIAPVENQSVYIQLANPLYIKQEDALYA
ncbi:siderophore biosynthesis protein [Acinetobacter johnsonii]|uniref:Siderophore biosynthesis protein n=1 Tax=Acinetobacter johnsonii TaxID=40214 RepID=A0A427UX74_ACIJO|nr:IucA/IucC family protein [Acinetobacter johnsonii]MDH1068857.1 siderophore biosynthesis protein [Acinetobacter johnsonii]MDH2172587.1 siderophore biosynthesis protein [Acinetobacter johnsonii]MDH2175590.1 siderophore biosynthesis protein [Acinetobacter johnsonii]RSE25079.1 siderophore biosynthesis protein [Acinetobacter johnsonii]